MRSKKISKPKPKATTKKPTNTMELLKNELYDIIRKEDETEELQKYFARKNKQKYKDIKENELYKIMEVICKSVKDLERNVSRVIKILEDIKSVEDNSANEQSEDEDLEDEIIFSGDVYCVKALISKLKDKYKDNSFTLSMSRSAMFTSTKRPTKDEWSKFIENLVKDKILVHHPNSKTNSQPRYKFP